MCSQQGAKNVQRPGVGKELGTFEEGKRASVGEAQGAEGWVVNRCQILLDCRH